MRDERGKLRLTERVPDSCAGGRGKAEWADIVAVRFGPNYPWVHSTWPTVACSPSDRCASRSGARAEIWRRTTRSRRQHQISGRGWRGHDCGARLTETGAAVVGLSGCCGSDGGCRVRRRSGCAANDRRSGLLDDGPGISGSRCQDARCRRPHGRGRWLPDAPATSRPGP